MNLPRIDFARLLALAAATLLATAPLAAQTAPAPAAADPSEPDKDAIQMTPFEVSESRSKGAYVQEEVTAVTKFAVPIIDVPQNIFVFNRSLLDDLNTGQLRDAMAFNAGIKGGLFSTGGSYRGFSNQQKLKDGFIMSAFFDYDTAHFERIELLKGPSAVMYGRTEPGGITNYVTKNPVPGVDFANITLGTGKNNKNTRKNLMFDFNNSYDIAGRSPIDVRVTGAYRTYQDSVDSQTENGEQLQGSARVAVSHWITDRTRILASYMYYKRYFETQFGRYGAFAVTVNQTTPGHSIPFSLVYGRDPFEDYGYGREFYWEFNDTQLFVDHKISQDLDFRFGFNLHKRTNEDYLLNIAATTLNGQGAIRQTGINKNKDDVFFPDVQAHIVWRPWEGHNVLLGYSRNWQYLDQKQWFNSRNPDGTAFSRTYIPANGIPRSLPADVVYVATAHNRQTADFATYTLNYHGGFMEKRLHVMAGVSFNDTKTTFRESAMRNRALNNLPPNFSTDDWAPQVGAIYKITKDISVFGLASKSTQYTFTRNSFGEYFGPITGEGFEAGFKFAFNDGRINGTLTYYNVDQKNNIVFDPLAVSLAYQQSVNAGTPNEGLRGDNVAAGVTNATGFEFEVNAAVTPQWNITFSYANSDLIFESDPNPVVRGTTVAGTEPNKAVLMTRYDFDARPNRGLFVGGGLIYIDKIFGGFSPGSNNTRNFWGKGGLRLDAFVGYKFNAFGIDQQIKLQGLGINKPTNRRHGFDPAINDGYYLKSKPIINLDWTVSF